MSDYEGRIRGRHPVKVCRYGFGTFAMASISATTLHWTGTMDTVIILCVIFSMVTALVLLLQLISRVLWLCGASAVSKRCMSAIVDALCLRAGILSQYEKVHDFLD
jgi:hypothetical protein